MGRVGMHDSVCYDMPHATLFTLLNVCFLKSSFSLGLHTRGDDGWPVEHGTFGWVDVLI